MPSIVTFGANDIGKPADTRYLTPGVSLVTAPTTAIGFIAPRSSALTSMRVRHNTPSSDSTVIDYHLRVNGVNKITVQLACNASTASNAVDIADLLVGDLVECVAVKPGVIATGKLNVSISVEDI
jgi:hypothetical protein